MTGTHGRLEGRLLLAIGLALASPAAALAQRFEPFADVKKEAAPAPRWAAEVSAGLLATAGNSEATTFSAGVKTSRRTQWNKLSAEGGVAFARTVVEVVGDANADGLIDATEVERQKTTTARLFQGVLRYDRFLTERNSLFVVAKALTDRPGGKDFLGGTQAGYSRLLVQTPAHALTGEAGYDFSFEDYTNGTTNDIHSARFFLGYEGKLRTNLAAAEAVEALTNLNEEAGGIGPFEDMRVSSKTSLTARLSDKISLRTSYTVKLDAEPAPRAPIGGLPFAPGITFDELDTLIEAALVVSVL